MTALKDRVEAELFGSGLISGFALLSHRHGDHVCTFRAGDIDSDQDWENFEDSFNSHKDIPSLKLLVREIEVKFTVFKKTESSIYGISEGTVKGIMVCINPNGLLVGTCPGSPSIINKAIPLFERFALDLRK